MDIKGFEIPDDVLQLIAKLSDAEEELTAKEQSRVQAWVDESPENEDHFKSLKELWHASALPEPPSLTGDVVSVMMQKLEGARMLSIDPSGTKADRVGRGDRESRMTIWALRIAAAVVLSLGIYGLQHWIQKNQPEPAIAFREFATANAQKMQLRLSDGSLVYLNAASQLRVPTAFSRGSREIYMQGEAFFKVAHGPSRFVVNTDLGKIEDIGTEFNVRVRGHQLQVVVAEGEVALYPEVDEEEAPGFTESSAARARLPVSAGQMAWLSARGKLDMPHKVDVERFLAWRKDILVFKKTPLAEVLQELTRQYDLDFRIRADLNRHSITAQFKGLTSDQVLSKLSLITDLSFQRDGQTVLISEQ